MAKLKNAPPPFLTRLESALVEGLQEAGIPAKVQYERIPTTRLYRLYVLAPKFKALRPMDRQDLVWRIADHAVPFKELLRVSTIQTLTPEELSGG